MSTPRVAHIRLRLWTGVIIALVTAFTANAQVPYLVSDINTSSTAVNSSRPASFQDIDGTLYFYIMEGETGVELWKHRGGHASLVADTVPGTRSLSPGNLASLGNGVVLFRAADPVRGVELWRTDGTPAGTVNVKDINPAGSGLTGFVHTVYRNKLYFVANEPDHGQEVWVSDGTEAGTTLFRDLNPGAASSSISMLTVFNDRLLIFAENAIWSSDGTAPVNIATIGNASGLARLGSVLYFTATGSAGLGRELWRTDGTTGGTFMLHDVAPGTASGLSTTSALTASGTSIYFFGSSSGTGNDLWKSDGTTGGTTFVAALPVNSSPRMVPSGAGVHIALGNQIWRSDGTSGGTYVLESAGASGLVAAFGRAYYFVSVSYWVNHLISSDGSVRTVVKELGPNGLTVFTGGKLYFSSWDPLHGYEPWVSEDGTGETTRLLANIVAEPPPSSWPAKLTAAGNRVFFIAQEAIAGLGLPGRELWSSDGTSGGTQRLTGRGEPLWEIAPVGNFVLFNQGHSELWRSDGSPSGTVPFRTGELFSSPLRSSGRYLYFAPSSSLSLMRTDGTEAGTVTLGDSLPDSRKPRSAGSMVRFWGRDYMHSGSNFDGLGIWVYGDSPASVHRLLNVSSTQSSSVLCGIAIGGGLIFYCDERPGTGVELMATDASVGGEKLIRDIAPGSASANPQTLTAAGPYVYFTADDGTHGREVWRSDGTADGTILLRDILVGPGSSSPLNLTAAGSLLYFTANDGVHGVELWRSDGTPEGTIMVADIHAGVASANPRYLRWARGALWFAADDGTHGEELWTVGTGMPMMVADLAPGAASSNPAELTEAGDLLFFSAGTSLGYELWALPLQGSAFEISDARVKEGNGGNVTAQFTVTRRGKTDGTSSVDYSTADGTATAGSDYVARTGTLSFSSGETVKTIDVIVYGDSAIEGNESFFVTLSNAVGAVLHRSRAAGVIEDDDQKADLEVSIVPNASGFERKVSITNRGPSFASDVAIRFTESPLKFDSSYSFDCPSRGKWWNCDITRIALGETVELRIRRSLVEGFTDPQAPPGQTVAASVTASESDPNPSNNATSLMTNRGGTLWLPAHLVSNTTSAANFAQPASSQVNVTLTSSSPNVVVAPTSVLTPLGDPRATFNLSAGSGTGPVLLTLGGAGVNPSQLVTHVVAPGSQPRLDVAIVAPPLQVIYGEDAEVKVEIAATKHDGTRPGGTVSLFDANGSTLLAERTLDGEGRAVFIRSGLPPGYHTFRIRYGGDSGFNSLDGAEVAVYVGGWPTNVALDMPGVLCAGTRAVPITVRTRHTSQAPSGSVQVTLGGTIIATLSLSPTGAAGESRAVLSHSFAAGDRYIGVSYLPTGSFVSSGASRSFESLPCISMTLSANGSATGVSMNWTATEAASYEVLRWYNRFHYTVVGSTSGTWFVDAGTRPGTTYLYTVRAKNGSGAILGYAPPDIATTITFSDDPLVSSATAIRAAHIDQLRNAAAAVRLFAAEEATSPPQVGVGSPVRAADLQSLRNEIITLRRSLGLADLTLTDPDLGVGARIRAAHFQELRDAVK